MKRLIALTLIVCMTGCTSMQVLGEGQYKAGDEVQVVTKDGQKRQVVVGATDASSIQGTVNGKPETIQRADIDRVEQKEVSRLKTGGAIYGVVAVAALLAALSLFKDAGKIGK